LTSEAQGIVQPVRVITVLIGTLAGCLAGIMAYLITYEEYSHHFIDKKRPRRMALEAALLAFAIFFGIGLVLALVL
jgi:O-antigen/teichoic acid export membrane protein